jgi:hypothetical protein
VITDRYAVLAKVTLQRLRPDFHVASALLAAFECEQILGANEL